MHLIFVIVALLFVGCICSQAFEDMGSLLTVIGLIALGCLAIVLSIQ